MFSGEYRDDAGLYYLRARSYDPATGQFLTVDPALASTGMAYAYTAGDPLQQVDPMGLDSSDSSGGQSVVGGYFNGLKTLGSGIAYGVAPWHWDDIKRSVQCSAEANGGGLGGWYVGATITLSPGYAIDAAFVDAWAAKKDGRWGDVAEDASTVGGINGLAIFAKASPSLAKVSLGAVAKVVNKVRVPATSVDVLKGVSAESAPRFVAGTDGIIDTASPALRQQIGDVVDSLKATGKPPAGVRQGSYQGQSGVYANLSGDLPARPLGYYTESDVWPGTGPRGTERIVTGQNGEVWYSPDHYGTFRSWP